MSRPAGKAPELEARSTVGVGGGWSPPGVTRAVFAEGGAGPEAVVVTVTVADKGEVAYLGEGGRGWWWGSGWDIGFVDIDRGGLVSGSEAAYPSCQAGESRDRELDTVVEVGVDQDAGSGGDRFSLGVEVGEFEIDIAARGEGSPGG